jgi:hypothetical protein
MVGYIQNTGVANGYVSLNPILYNTATHQIITTNYYSNWSGGGFGQISVPTNQTATYTVNLMDWQTGCIVTVDTTITAATNPNCATLALALTQMPLPNNQVQVRANATGGTPPYTYSSYWYNPTTSSYINGGNINTANVNTTAATGIYFYVTDANGCVRTAYDTIPVNLCATLALSLTQTPLPNNQAQVTANANGGTLPYTYNYEWYNMITQSMIAGTSNSVVLNYANSNYISYNITDGAGCVVHQGISIVNPNCAGVDVQLNRVIDIPNNTVTFSVSNAVVNYWAIYDPVMFSPIPVSPISQTLVLPTNQSLNRFAQVNITTGAGCHVQKTFNYNNCGFTQLDANYRLYRLR